MKKYWVDRAYLIPEDHDPAAPGFSLVVCVSDAREDVINDFRMDELDAVMHSVDKWFDDGDFRLKRNPATRASDAREIALKAIESIAAERDRLREALDILKEAIEDSGHVSYCNARKGPEDEGWTVEDECNCWVKKARLLLAALRSGQGEPREVVRWFAGEMERKLKINDYKGGWAKCDRAYLLARLREECEELIDATTPEGAIAESADVANMAMMIADNARRQPAALAPEKGSPIIVHCEGKHPYGIDPEAPEDEDKLSRWM